MLKHRVSLLLSLLVVAPVVSGCWASPLTWDLGVSRDQGGRLTIYLPRCEVAAEKLSVRGYATDPAKWTEFWTAVVADGSRSDRIFVLEKTRQLTSVRGDYAPLKVGTTNLTTSKGVFSADVNPSEMVVGQIYYRGVAVTKDQMAKIHDCP